MKGLLYKPFAIVAGIIGTRLGKRTFKALWRAIDSSPAPPPATAGEASLLKAAGGAALEAATIAAIAATVDRVSARAFRHLFGFWPAKTASEAEPTAAA
jgi:uncharacterized protein DUF4235